MLTAGQLDLLPAFSRPFRAWENGVANPGRRSPARFALGYSLSPRRGCQEDGVTLRARAQLLGSPQDRMQRMSRENAQEAQKFVCLCVLCAFSRLFLWPHM